MAGQPLITVVIPTSPIPSHPSTRIITETITSVRIALPDAPILITCDGVREEDRALTAKYEAYKDALEDRWKATTIVRYRGHVHQCEMLGIALPLILTPLVLYLEHDWEILPHIEWSLLTDLLLDKYVNYVKLYSGERIHPLHEHMMGEREIVNGVPLIHTRQFSANPHLARTDWYREMYPYMNGATDFVENILHGILGQLPMTETKMVVYNPIHGSMARCKHLDGRGER